MSTVTTGQVVQVRSRRYLVQRVEAPRDTEGNTTVHLACVEDDAQGQPLSVFWEQELDARVLGEASWDVVGQRGFDEPDRFSAYLHTLRWNCVTSTKANLFQSPYRAGIQVKAYQLEPLRKALQMPRVSLFIADDVGLGKTIEAGLILRELILRQKVERVVISCPPSVVQQWQEEMESRFGLLFQIFDRAYVAQKRRQRGYGINPWKTHNRFIISHALLRDETYAAPLRDWLNTQDGKTLLILDEAHNAAPASSARYAVDSRLTKIVREICPLFEHKLFLSATPHNGHSNSFAALLEMLDPQRFCRGVPVRSKKMLDDVMVRRLKKDLRAIQITDFPERQVIPITIDGLPKDAPELVLAELLQEYRNCRQKRLQNASQSNQRAAMLVVISLQKRLLSSIEAFARTLKVHRNSIERQAKTIAPTEHYTLLEQSVGSDDDRAELDEKELEQEEDAQMVAATQATGENITQRELELLQEMTTIAENARHQADGRIVELVNWVKDNLCPDLGKPGAVWNDRRVLIFTEYTDTKRYLETQLKEAIGQSDRANDGLGTFHGGMGDEARELIKAAFNANPQSHPLRILIATDAAREGVNLQNYCADLFHFDVPWNPSRMEQRNGRIDRKLQREPVVRCHYFVYAQRPEDKVLQTLVTKTETIARELGSLSPVLEKNVDRILKQGIQRQETDQLRLLIDSADQDDETTQGKGRVIKEELEAVREVESKLLAQQNELEGLLERSRQWLGFEVGHFQDALSVSLDLMGVDPLQPVKGSQLWEIPGLEQQFGGDPSWGATLDSLRAPRQKGQSVGEWRRESPVRPVVFSDPNSLDGQVVHLHLEHRLVQRLLGRFLSQGFVHHELSRACVCRTQSAIPKVIVLGRLSLYGDRAARLHDEVLAVAAEWIAPDKRGNSKLRPLKIGEKDEVLEELEKSLGDPQLSQVDPKLLAQFQVHAAQDVADLRPHLEQRSLASKKWAIRELTQRGDREAQAMVDLLQSQKRRIHEELPGKQEAIKQLTLEFSDAERRQLKLDVQFLETRLTRIDRELEEEPLRIRQTYEVQADRIEPVGLVYLWPLSN
ncbi:MAG: DISARM system SNF2-like helicase DrmD [Synechococcales bacterium]|nr:DISARM system SNF2-like helicase DrmD [Synechococcales bacterium]